MDILKRIPFLLGAMIYVGYLGYQYYDYAYAPSGRVEQHRAVVKSGEDEVKNLKKKLEEGNQFLKSLDLKRDEIRSQVRRLSDYQGALSESSDIPSLIKMIYTEAKKIEMKVDKIEPGSKNQREYYLEQEFKIDIRGSYQQILLFIHRISQLQRILRIEGFGLKVSPNSISSRALTLAGSLSVRAYQYTVSKEDQLGSEGAIKK